MTIYFITQRKALIDKLADIIDLAEGYRADVRRPGYVTVRHANTDAHPDGVTYAYINDDIIWKNRNAILDELAKYGIGKAAIAAKYQKIKDGISTNETVTFNSGAMAGVSLVWTEKGSDWTPPAT